MSDNEITKAVQQLQTIEHNGEPVVTLRMVDELHQRPDGTAGRNFRQHRGRLMEGVDYWEVPEEAATNYVPAPRGGSVILLSESGYLMLVKAFRDDLAWEVQRALVTHYFRSKALQTPSEHRLIGAEVARGIREGLEAGFAPINKRLDGVEKGLGDLRDEVRSCVRRKDLTQKTMRQHTDTLLWLGPKCPCCEKRDVIDEYGCKLPGANWDHWYAPHRATPHETWLVCAECNQAMKDPEFRASRQRCFDRYQLRREEKHYPLIEPFTERKET